jgi:hypothetical protein
MSFIHKIIFVFTCTLIFFLIFRLYIYLRRQKAKKERKIFCYYGFNFWLALLISFLLLFPYIKISDAVFLHSFNDFQIQLAGNIDDVDFEKLYEEIYDESGADGPITNINSGSIYLSIDVDRNGIILDFSVIFNAYKGNKGVIYDTNFLENNIIEFSHLDYIQELDELESDQNDLKKAFQNLDKINFGKALTFFEGIEESPDLWALTERIILNFSYKSNETPSEYSPNPSRYSFHMPSYYMDDEDSYRLIDWEETYVGSMQELVVVLKKDTPDAFWVPSLALYSRIE